MPVISTSGGPRCATDGLSKAAMPSTRAGPDRASRRSRRACPNNRKIRVPGAGPSRPRDIPPDRPGLAVASAWTATMADRAAVDPGDRRESRGCGSKRPACALPDDIADKRAAVDAQVVTPGKRVAKRLTAKNICSDMVNVGLRHPPRRRRVRRSAEFPGLPRTSGAWRRAVAGHRPARDGRERRPGAGAASHFGRSFSRSIC